MKDFTEFFRSHPHYNGDCGLNHPLPCEFALNYFDYKLHGIFVDIGAHNGIAWSNSLIFEELYGWTGLCIEPNPTLYSQMTKVRTAKCLNCAVDANTEKQLFWSIDGGASGIGGLERGFKGNHKQRIYEELPKYDDSVLTKMEIHPRRLDEIMAAENISVVDYLSIDVEGNEFGVLNSFDFAKHSVKLISVESNDRESVQILLGKRGYRLIAKICADDFYEKI